MSEKQLGFATLQDRNAELETMLRRNREETDELLDELKRERSQHCQKWHRAQAAEQKVRELEEQIHRLNGISQTLMSAIEFWLPGQEELKTLAELPDNTPWPLLYITVDTIRFGQDALAQARQFKETRSRVRANK